MPLFEMTRADIVEVPTTSFSAAAIKEKEDLQRLLRDRIEIVARLKFAEDDRRAHLASDARDQ